MRSKYNIRLELHLDGGVSKLGMFEIFDDFDFCIQVYISGTLFSLNSARLQLAPL